ncbi:STAS domain-containing protein [Candidatus Nitrospira neomarina]|uniref:Anti-sigma factor antagonist n=1 Tax=Candidatus Nitrospira neomarina TaxID=3020899 RepID=A0AA96GP54_9BACT|nr:STAS domain-containing protein [Candidatus Nitrospira neomarina]WNM62793.1 STAS domain-containing protein [Candidatus Nitrospira neomarina]
MAYTMEEFMNVTQEKRENVVVVHLAGRFDFGARKTFKDGLGEAMKEELPIVLNFGEVSFVDSSALGILVIAHQTLKSKKIPFSLVNPQPYVRQVLDLANVAKMIPIYQTIGEVPQMAVVSS